MAKDIVLITREACDYLRISRPTYTKYLQLSRIRGTKAGNGWRVLEKEFDLFPKSNESWAILERLGEI